VPAGTLPASSGISPVTRSCRRWTKASALSASALVPKKIVSKTLAVWESRWKGFSLALVCSVVPTKASGLSAPIISARWP
jgi:hypothetical protein